MSKLFFIEEEMAIISKDIDAAAALLREGALVAMPTETVYGLAGNALRTDTVAEIFRVKERPHFDPLIIHLPSFEASLDYIHEPPQLAKLLAEKFMPGPLTILLPRKAIIPDLVTSGSPLVAVRVPAHHVARALLQKLDFPLAAPSANPFGYISPTAPEHVQRQLGAKIPFILDGGASAVGIESTIVGFNESRELTVYRKGGLPVEAIEAIAGKVNIMATSSSKPLSPGQLDSHYAPRTPMIMGCLPELIEKYQDKNIGILCFIKPELSIPAERLEILSASGSFTEAASNLFAAMHRLDQKGFDVILTSPLPEVDLGRAINDRLRRASYQG